MTGLLALALRPGSAPAFVGAALAIVALAGPGNASTSSIGRTWPIAEPDALSEIEARAAHAPGMRQAYGPRSRWSAMKAAPLGETLVDRRRTVVPFYTLDQDIRLPDGRLLYARGYTFNPLAYVSLPQRLIVVHPQELDWALRVARPTDYVLLAAGRPGDPDAVTLGERRGRALFLLEQRVKDRLDLTVAPVIVAQAGQKLILDEVGPASRLARTGTAR